MAKKANTVETVAETTEEKGTWFVDPKDAASGSSGSTKDGKVFYLDYGDEVEIVSLDENPDEGSAYLKAPILNLSEVWYFESEEANYPRYIADNSVDGETKSILGSYAEENLDADTAKQEGQTRKKLIPGPYYITSVLVAKEGEATRKAFRLIPVNTAWKFIKDSNAIRAAAKGPMKDLDGYQNCLYSCSRASKEENKMAAKIGEFGNFLGALSDEELGEMHPSPVPYTRDEIKNAFVVAEDQIQAYVDRKLRSTAPKKPKIND